MAVSKLPPAMQPAELQSCRSITAMVLAAFMENQDGTTECARSDRQCYAVLCWSGRDVGPFSTSEID